MVGDIPERLLTVLVQPMMAKMILPVGRNPGGLECLHVVLQTTLLAGMAMSIF